MSLAFMDNYARIRKMLYAPAQKQAKALPKPKPIVAYSPVIPQPRPVVIVPERQARQCYIMPISGPCQPNHKYFEIYNGARDVLQIQSDEPKPKIEDCIRFVIAQSGISRTLLLGSQRTQDIVILRQQVMWIAKTYTGKSSPEIGKHMGGRDHTTILHGVRKLQALKESGAWVPPTLEEVASFAQSRKQ